jgi:hypothetical protein
MPRWFNIAGPCFADEHYLIPPERRSVEAAALIAQGRWFSLVAGRQTGKTTTLQSLARAITAGGASVALWVDLQVARDQADVALAMPVLLDRLADVLARAGLGALVPDAGPVAAWLATPATALEHYLGAVCAASERPIVLLFDEADVIVGAAMVSFLTQLRALYLARRERAAPRSVVLAGVRAVRDYVTATDDRRQLGWLGTASPFNVTVENVGLAPFTAAEVGELLAQHTAETGQRFEPNAVARVHELTAGHPWLVNALADQTTRRDVTDRAVVVTAEHIERAKETIILERRTHIDSLLARLREDRVRRVLDPMIAGETVAAGTLDDDVAYVAGLSLIRVVGGQWRVANPIYREVIPRALTYVTQTSIHQQTAWYLRPDGGLDMGKLMAGWQEFWREDGHLAAEGFTYKESGPHLMMMAFLQRIVNGGGRIDREYALGKGALDLLVTWKGERHVIELKQRRDTRTLAKGVAQVAGYARSLGLKEAWLVMFDKRKSVPWSKRLFRNKQTSGGVTVHGVGC